MMSPGFLEVAEHLTANGSSEFALPSNSEFALPSNLFTSEFVLLPF